MKYESENLTFMKDDVRDVIYPHNDPLVLIIQIANTRVNFVYSGNVTEGALFNTYYSLGGISSNNKKFRGQKSTSVIVRGEKKQFVVKKINGM